jgi:hypothetical protein
MKIQRTIFYTFTVGEAPTVWFYIFKKEGTKQTTTRSGYIMEGIKTHLINNIKTKQKLWLAIELGVEHYQPSLCTYVELGHHETPIFHLL